jgi:hypothetical protein
MKLCWNILHSVQQANHVEIKNETEKGVGKSQTIYCGIKEAPYLVLNNLSRHTTRVLSRPGTSNWVCNALQNQWRKWSINFYLLFSNQHWLNKTLVLLDDKEYKNLK